MWTAPNENYDDDENCDDDDDDRGDLDEDDGHVDDDHTGCFFNWYPP